MDIDLSIYDECTYYTNCIVEVLRNSVTGQTSVGWYRTEETKELTDYDDS